MKNQISLIIVEDDLDEQQLLKETLEATGHFIVLNMASHRNGLMNALTANIPDAILCAYHLPAQNGVEILKELKEHNTYASIPFIIVDNGYDETYKNTAAQLEPTGFLSRPVSAEGYQNFETNLYDLLKPLKGDAQIDQIKG
jgi:CheY-like chemotaxis protein